LRPGWLRIASLLSLIEVLSPQARGRGGVGICSSYVSNHRLHDVLGFATGENLAFNFDSPGTLDVNRPLLFIWLGDFSAPSPSKHKRAHIECVTYHEDSATD
jgi:hypothetical protein